MEVSKEVEAGEEGNELFEEKVVRLVAGLHRQEDEAIRRNLEALGYKQNAQARCYFRNRYYPKITQFVILG